MNEPELVPGLPGGGKAEQAGGAGPPGPCVAAGPAGESETAGYERHKA